MTKKIIPTILRDIWPNMLHVNTTAHVYASNSDSAKTAPHQTFLE